MGIKQQTQIYNCTCTYVRTYHISICYSSFSSFNYVNTHSYMHRSVRLIGLLLFQRSHQEQQQEPAFSIHVEEVTLGSKVFRPFVGPSVRPFICFSFSLIYLFLAPLYCSRASGKWPAVGPGLFWVVRLKFVLGFCGCFFVSLYFNGGWDVVSPMKIR